MKHKKKNPTKAGRPYNCNGHAVSITNLIITITHYGYSQ